MISVSTVYLDTVEPIKEADMRVSKWSVFVCCFVAALTGCTNSTMKSIMSSWEGEHIDSVIEQWGFPNEEKEIAGHKLYVWYRGRSFYVPATSTTTGYVYGNSFSANTSTFGGYPVHAYCTRILEVDDSGHVTRWQWEGNDCPCMEIFEYAHWRNKSNEDL